MMSIQKNRNWSAAETVDSASIFGRVKSQTIYNGIYSFPVSHSALKGVKGNVKSSPSVVNRWTRGSLTQGPSSFFAAFWSRQLRELTIEPVL